MTAARAFLTGAAPTRSFVCCAPGRRWAGKKTGCTPTDRGKRGIEHTLMTEGQGVPNGLAVEGANRHAMQLVRPTIESIVVERPDVTEQAPLGMWLDKGYDYDEVGEILAEVGFTAHSKARGDEAKEPKAEADKRARRWVVECSHRWMNRFGCILVRWDKKPENYIGFLHFACALIALRAAGLLG